VDRTYTFNFDTDAALTSLQTTQLETFDYYQARLDLFNLSLMADYDQLTCLSSLTAIDKYWYQIETAKKVLRQLGGRALLADEVGLGKTIEAGLIIAEYLTRGMVRSLLILTPASLVSQWQLELSEKFNISTITTDARDLQQAPAEFWTENPRIVASINMAKSAKHYAFVTNRAWDLVVVDEAHHLKNRSTLNWKLVNDLQKRFILMLTATPVQNSLVELFNLLTLLKPGLLQTEALFKKQYVDSKNGRMPKNPEQLRSLMREVMIRNTRALVDVKLPKRFATTITVVPDQAEQQLYQDLSAYLRLQTAGLDRLSRTNLLMRAGSSPGALADSLKQLSKRIPDEELLSLAKRAAQIKQVEKAKILVEMLGKSHQKTLVFSAHKATSLYLAKALQAANIPFAEFQGGMSLKEKDAAIASFRDEVGVLLASETGGEGRNIQFANAIINYDLPWNPMKIEQRIGRIHRIGQVQDVFIFNFCLKDSIEEYILQILHDKINMFELVVGEVETILGNADSELDFSEVVMDIWLQHQVKPELDQAFNQLADNLLQAKDRYREIQVLDEQIFGEDFEA
jgi:SNF2 family DNA or RNA helicase